MLSNSERAIARPTACPSCNGAIIDTLAKTITASTFWRCLSCNHTWTIASQQITPSRRY